VEYGQDWNFGQSVTAQTMPYGGNYLHIAEITGLKPGTRYYYRAGKPYDWSGGYTFLTAPRPGTPFHFTVWGDTQHYPEKIVTIRIKCKN
jgi:phosphodiesterase/alkaline phosphatase D-like protein